MSEEKNSQSSRSSQGRPYSSVVLPTEDYIAEMTIAAQRLSDSQFFFSEQRLAQLFDIESWPEEEQEHDVDDFKEGSDSDREPPPEPAPRCSYCPPSPGTTGQPNLVDNFATHIFSENSIPDQRFSADVAMHMSRLSALSTGSARFSSSRDGDEDGFGGEGASDVTPTPDSPTSSCKNPNSARLSVLSQLTDIPSSRCSYATSSLPSVLSDLAGEMGAIPDLLTDDDDGPGPLVWGDDQVNWQERCLELELSLQRFRDQAGKIRELLREKVSDFFKIF